MEADHFWGSLLSTFSIPIGWPVRHPQYMNKLDHNDARWIEIAFYSRIRKGETMNILINKLQS